MGELGNLETVGLGKQSQLSVADLLDDLSVLLVPNIADAFEEEHWEDVGLEVSRVHRTTEDVGGFPKMALQLTEGNA